MLRVDLRSDTGTLPTRRMQQAMTSARVGDDSRGECAVTGRLEREMARLMGKGAAVFVPTCTMANNLVLLQHRLGGLHRMACGAGSHIGVRERFKDTVLGLDVALCDVGVDGLLDEEHVLREVGAGAGLVCFENSCWPTGAVFGKLPRPAAGCSVHLDGARLWHAEGALGQKLSELSEGADTVAVCFSKGLSAPGGAAVCGDVEQIDELRALRKTVGGAMRQSAGQLAAAMLVALEERHERVQEDHARARSLAEGLAALDGQVVNSESFAAGISTNVVLWAPATRGDVGLFAAALKERGVLMLPAAEGTVLRAMVHRMVGEEELAHVLEACTEVERELSV